MGKQRRFHLDRRVRWHRGSGRWVVTIGRVLTKHGHLADKDWYFPGTFREEESNAKANALAQRWAVICRNWARTDQPLLQSFGEPFPEEPRWNRGDFGSKGREITPEEAQRLEDENGVSEDLINQTLQEYTLRGFVAFYGESRQEEMKRHTLRHASWRKLLSQMRSAVAFFPEDVPAKDLKQNHFLEAKDRMYKKHAVRTVRNYLSAVLELVRYVYKTFMGDPGVPSGIQDACSVPKATRTDIRVYGIDELKEFLAATKGSISQLDVMLALNCGMYPQDIGRLRLDEIDLTDGSVFWDREKQPKNPFKLHHVLWPETLLLLKRFMNDGPSKGKSVLDFRRGPETPETLNPAELAVLDQGKPRYWATPGGHEKDWVSKRMKETLKGVLFRDLRKSANELLLETIEGDGSHDHTVVAQELSDHFLGHKTDRLVQTYRLMRKRTYVRMNRYLKKLGDRLRDTGVFDDLAK